MKNFLFILILFALPFTALSQGNRITLETCRENALKHYPIAAQKPILRQQTELALADLDRNFLPKLQLNAMAGWQSDVATVPVNIPGVEIQSPLRDKLSATVDASQLIWDGGRTKLMKRVEEAGLLADEKSLDVELFPIRSRINELFFGVLMMQDRASLIDLIRENIELKLEQAEALVKNGLMLESNVDVLEAELLKLDQQSAEVEATRLSFIQMLETLMGTKIPQGSVFEAPDPEDPAPGDLSARPEMEAFDYAGRELESRKELVQANRKPTVSAFAQGGLGRPGLDIFSTSFNPIFVAGIQFNWLIWDWNRTRDQKQSLDLGQALIQTRKSAFDLNTRVALEKEMAEIGKALTLIEQDREIIRMREKISESASKQLDNGLINATQYLTELNAEQQARLSLKTHELQLLLARINYLTIQGK
jgi:outer membrane protein TolC